MTITTATTHVRARRQQRRVILPLLFLLLLGALAFAAFTHTSLTTPTFSISFEKKEKIKKLEFEIDQKSLEAIKEALKVLTLYPIFKGYRGLPKASLEKTTEVIFKISSLIVENNINIEEIEINPLIVTPKGAYSADALISMKRNH